jgi:hypothetical protein
MILLFPLIGATLPLMISIGKTFGPHSRISPLDGDINFPNLPTTGHLLSTSELPKTTALTDDASNAAPGKKISITSSDAPANSAAHPVLPKLKLSS